MTDKETFNPGVTLWWCPVCGGFCSSTSDDKFCANCGYTLRDEHPDADLLTYVGVTRNEEETT